MIYGNMSDLTACSVKSCNDLSIYDDTAADTGSKCYHDNVFTAFSCPLPHLSESCHVGIISCFDLKTCQISEFFLYIHDSPA